MKTKPRTHDELDPIPDAPDLGRANDAALPANAESPSSLHHAPVQPGFQTRLVMPVAPFAPPSAVRVPNPLVPKRFIAWTWSQRHGYA